MSDPGRIFGDRYELDEELGSGGMATVYRGTDRVLGRTVAVKVLAPNYARDQAFVARFRREAQNAARMNHPGVVNVYDTGSDNGTFSETLSYANGQFTITNFTLDVNGGDNENLTDGGTETTQTFTPDEGEDTSAEALEDLGITGPALVVRSGGGRAGETFHPEGETSIGRSPDCGIFLDDVTVSRKHAVLVQSDGQFRIEDLGSLNGTFVNRRRIDEATRLQSGDEVQIGKYRLSFISK